MEGQEQSTFRNKALDLVDIISSVKAKIQLNCSFCPGFVSNADGHVLSLLGIKPHLRKAFRIASYTWRPPSTFWIKVNTYGCSKGNPCASACSGVFRDEKANFRGRFSLFLGHCTSFVAEMKAGILAFNIASEQG
ncbi:hypothetical protein Dsin_001972 [Dipteronia sinensis]|uniref:RNase H type-1 domain-containing protein n=1 Tax=Dipteronia sinensis TaxID=43782 RepID=A0AAE0EIY9_9ROSI|nr:hypothetical protein Dsin_001972 [Dipteronia sinensis]